MTFWFKEAFRLAGRSKSSTSLSVISTALAVLLITASYLLVQLSDRIAERLSGDLTLELFLEPNLQNTEVNKIKRLLEGYPQIRKLDFIDKDEAARRFISETGEDFRKILDYNPLPASFVLYLSSIPDNSEDINSLVKELNAVPGVDEVVYKTEFIKRIAAVIEKFKLYIFIAAVALVLISVYMIFSTTKLILNSLHDEIETMKLVGAGIPTIKMPLIINSIFTGALAGLIAGAVFYIMQDYIVKLSKLFSFISDEKYFYMIAMIAAGSMLGLFVTLFATRKLSLRI
ncbi:MAG: permease-like cell division protein FtsX [Ignavibacteriaceae bacterium]